MQLYFAGFADSSSCSDDPRKTFEVWLELLTIHPSSELLVMSELLYRPQFPYPFQLGLCESVG